MTAIAKPLIAVFHLPRLTFTRPFGATRRRRRTTIDLIHASPHLLRDIGLDDGHIGERRR